MQILKLNVAKLKYQKDELKTIYYDNNKQNFVASNTNQMLILNKDLDVDFDLYIETKTIQNINPNRSYPEYFRIIPTSFKNEFLDYNEFINFKFYTNENTFYKFNIDNKTIDSTIKFILKNCKDIKYFFCGLVFKIEFLLDGIKGIYISMPFVATESSPANFNKSKFEKNMNIFLSSEKVKNLIGDPPTNFF